MRVGLTPILGAGLVLATLLTIHVLPGLASVLLLVFAGAILAVLLEGLIRSIQHFLPGGHHQLAYAFALLLIVLVLAGIGLLIGPRIATEAPQLVQRIPEAWDSLIDHLNDFAMIDSVAQQGQRPFQWLTSNLKVTNLLSSTFGALFNIFVVILVGIYAAATPERYLRVSQYLLPARTRRRASDLSRNLGYELRHWLLGRLASMTIVGVASGIGLWLLGVPLALTLGLLAGLLSFVPYIGPILGLIPALLIAALESFALAGWVLVLYGGVQLVETALLTPLIQQRVVALPPVILISVQLVGGALIGPLGVLLGAPLVVCGITVGRWYRETVHETGEQLRQPDDS